MSGKRQSNDSLCLRFALEEGISFVRPRRVKWVVLDSSSQKRAVATEGMMTSPESTDPTITTASCTLVVVGKVYPAYSKTHDEVVCTGGIRRDTQELVRLHPIPFRSLDGQHRFSNWQWVRLKMGPDRFDTRPGSFRVVPQSIEVGEVVRSHDGRRDLVECCKQQFDSLLDLRTRNAQDRTSLGIVRPVEVIRAVTRLKSDEEREEWLARERAVMEQGRLFGDTPKKIDFPEMEFSVEWRCAEINCPAHTMGLRQWGIHELYRRLKDDGATPREASGKIEARLRTELDLERRDLYFFLGNHRSHQTTFGLMDVLSLPKDHDAGQGSLF